MMSSDFLKTPLALAAGGSVPKVHPSVLDAIAKVESNFNPNAINPKSGAMGMFQFMPATAKELGIDPMNPEEARRGAERYFGMLLERTGDFDKALAAYNWGIGNVEKKGMEKMPKETREYIKKVHVAMGKGEKVPEISAEQEAPGVETAQEMADLIPQVAFSDIDPKILLAFLANYSPSVPWGNEEEAVKDESLLADEEEDTIKLAKGGIVAPFGIQNLNHPKNMASGPLDVQWNTNNMIASARRGM